MDNLYNSLNEKEETDKAETMINMNNDFFLVYKNDKTWIEQTDKHYLDDNYYILYQACNNGTAEQYTETSTLSQVI